MHLQEGEENDAYKDEHEKELQQSLDRYGVKIIKVVGVFGVTLGLIILAVFWYWILSKLF